MIRQNELDAGFDLIAQNDGIVSFGKVTTFHTGEIGKVPPGTVGLVCSRSGLAFKHGVQVVNAPGIIDAGFSGEIMVALTSVDESVSVRKGDRIAQIVFLPLSGFNPHHTSGRGEKGFGSTGQ